MASLSHRAGAGIIQFTLGRKRQTLRLGKCTKAQARSAKFHVEHLISARTLGHPPDPKTQAWVRDLGDTIHKRLAAVNLVEPRASATLGEFVDTFIEDRQAEFKPATVEAWEYGKASLLAYFKADRDIRTITEGDAQAYRAWLVGEGYAEATVRRRCAHAKRFLSYAVRKRLIEINPFGNGAVPTAAPRGKEKFFVPADLSARIIDCLPDARWRLIWALGRWGGVRVPSEIAALRWDGVDWERMRLTVYSPKTERYEDQGSRVIPIFPEIQPHLADWWDLAEQGQVMVFPGASTKGAAYSTTLTRAIKRAGGQPWRKLWTSARATRDNEIREISPVLADAWIGHSSEVARKSYKRKVTDADFAKALQNPTQNPTEPPRTSERKGHQKTPARPVRPETGVASWPTGT